MSNKITSECLSSIAGNSRFSPLVNIQNWEVPPRSTGRTRAPCQRRPLSTRPHVAERTHRPIEGPASPTGAEHEPHNCSHPERPPPQPQFRADTERANDIHHRAEHPWDLSPFGSLPPSHNQVQEFNVWNQSAHGRFPPLALRGPGHAGPPSPAPQDPAPPHTSRKRKRTTPLDSATVGGYRPIPGSPDDRTEPSTPGPISTIEFTGRKNSAYEIWAFARPAETDEMVPADQWPDDYDEHLQKRPDAMFIGCKLCTQFGYLFYPIFSHPITYHKK